jgi:hypothetical protein
MPMTARSIAYSTKQSKKSRKYPSPTVQSGHCTDDFFINATQENGHEPPSGNGIFVIACPLCTTSCGGLIGPLRWTVLHFKGQVANL